jgi:cell division septation protein DedD
VVDTIAQKVVAKSEEKPAEPVKATTEEPVKKAPVKVAESPQQPYCIVLASQVRKSNAEDYVQQLKKRGFEEAEVYIHNNVVRVIFGAYASESEAYRQLNKMASHEEFGDAWVYKIQG